MAVRWTTIPSPGNKKGGLTTILEKSLGAVAKGGTAPLTQVYKFAEPVTERGFVFMDSPGYDPCSVTGQIASGANLVALHHRARIGVGLQADALHQAWPPIRKCTGRMSEDMDLNCGDIVSEGVSLEDKGLRDFRAVPPRVASGEQTKSEELGFGGAEFVPWQMGAVM
jgi:altronate dehydratase